MRPCGRGITLGCGRGPLVGADIIRPVEKKQFLFILGVPASMGRDDFASLAAARLIRRKTAPLTNLVPAVHRKYLREVQHPPSYTTPINGGPSRPALRRSGRFLRLPRCGSKGVIGSMKS